VRLAQASDDPSGYRLGAGYTEADAIAEWNEINS
jgi:hypothetical protein